MYRLVFRAVLNLLPAYWDISSNGNGYPWTWGWASDNKCFLWDCAPCLLYSLLTSLKEATNYHVSTFPPETLLAVTYSVCWVSSPVLSCYKLADDANLRGEMWKEIHVQPKEIYELLWISFVYIKVRNVVWTQATEFLFQTFSTLKSLFCAYAGSFKLPWRLCCIPEGKVGSYFWEPVEIQKWVWIKTWTTGWEKALNSIFHCTM